MNEKLNGNCLNGSLNMEDRQEVNGCHCERSVAIPYGKNVIARNEMIYQIHSSVIASEAWQSHKKVFINILKRLPRCARNDKNLRLQHSLWSLVMTICQKECFFATQIAMTQNRA